MFDNANKIDITCHKLRTIDMDRIRQFQAFLNVADLGNLTRAAKAMKLPRSTISTEIQKLEDRLQVQLFNRSTRNVALTADGHRLLPLAREAVDAHERAENLFRAHSEVEGRLRVDLPSRLGHKVIVPQLGAFLSAYPKLDLDVSVTDRYTDLVAEGVDCVIRMGRLYDSEIICRRLGDAMMINCASTDYLSRFGKPLSLQDLKDHQIVNYAIDLPAQASLFDSEDKVIAVKSRVTVDNADAYLAAGVAGLGIIQVPRFDVKAEIERGHLVEILPQDRLPPIQISALYAKRRNLPKKVSVFLDWLSEILEDESVI